jgi:hypothetical protein
MQRRWSRKLVVASADGMVTVSLSWRALLAWPNAVDPVAPAGRTSGAAAYARALNDAGATAPGNPNVTGPNRSVVLQPS